MHDGEASKYIVHSVIVCLREWVGGDSDQITTNAPLHMMGSMLSCLITNDDEIARLPKLIIPKTFTCIGTIWKNLGFSDMSLDSFIEFFGSQGADIRY